MRRNRTDQAALLAEIARLEARGVNFVFSVTKGGPVYSSTSLADAVREAALMAVETTGLPRSVLRAVMLAGGVAIASSLVACEAVVPSTPVSYDTYQPQPQYQASIQPPDTGSGFPNQTLDLGPVDAAPIAQSEPDAEPNAVEADPEPGPQQASVGPASLELGSGPVAALTDAAGGYVMGRQAEHLIRKTINNRRLAKEAAAVGAGAASTRAATGGRAMNALRGGAGAVEGEGAAVAGGEGAAVAGGEGAVAGEGAAVARGGAAAGEAALGGEIAEGGLALGAGEALAGAAIIGGAAVLGYEIYQHFSSTPAQAHSR